MKRNWDTIRKILLDVENMINDRQQHYETRWRLEDEIDTAELDYHIRLLRDSEFIRAEAVDRVGLIVTGLTWKGHDLLDQIREEL